MRKYILVFIFLFSTAVLFGQSETLKGLLKNLENAKDDTTKVSLLLSIVKEYFSASEFDSALFYNNECERLLSKFDTPQYMHR
jgi:hypothetical protein